MIKKLSDRLSILCHLSSAPFESGRHKSWDSVYIVLYWKIRLAWDALSFHLRANPCNWNRKHGAFLSGKTSMDKNNPLPSSPKCFDTIWIIGVIWEGGWHAVARHNVSPFGSTLFCYYFPPSSWASFCNNLIKRERFIFRIHGDIARLRCHGGHCSPVPAGGWTVSAMFGDSLMRKWERSYVIPPFLNNLQRLCHSDCIFLSHFA